MYQLGVGVGTHEADAADRLTLTLNVARLKTPA